MIKFNCENCGKVFTSKDEYAGRKFTCTNCDQALRIPSLDELQRPSAVADPVPTNCSPSPPLKKLAKAPARRPKQSAEDSSVSQDDSQIPRRTSAVADIARKRLEETEALPTLVGEELPTLEQATWFDRVCDNVRNINYSGPKFLIPTITIAFVLMIVLLSMNPPRERQLRHAEEEPIRDVAAERESKTKKDPKSGLTKANFNRIESGMSYREVVEIIGKEGEELSRVEIPGVPATVMYSWKKWSGANMNATFQDDRLVSKAQFGL